MRACRASGVPPGDHEYLLTVLDEVLDQAAAGREVKGVVLVDRRRHDKQRHLTDLLGLRAVLDELELLRGAVVLPPLA